MAMLQRSGLSDYVAMSGSIWFRRPTQPYGDGGYTQNLTSFFVANWPDPLNWFFTVWLGVYYTGGLFFLDSRNGPGGTGRWSPGTSAVLNNLGWNHLFFNFHGVNLLSTFVVNGVAYDCSLYGGTVVAGVWLSGMELGVPLSKNTNDLYFVGGIPSPAIDFGPYQVWMSYIEHNDNNFSKFIKVTGTLATPQPISVANNYFGTPAICFNGNHTAFVNNTGTFGPFNKIGAISDFTPGPSYNI